MKKTLFIPLFVGLVLSFQNCGKSNQAQISTDLLGSDDSGVASGGSTGGLSSGTGVTDLHYDLTSVDSIVIPAEVLASLTGNPSSGSSLQIDINHRRAALVDSSGTVVLKSQNPVEIDEIEELKQLLGSSSLCPAIKNTDPNLMCTMIYQFPYVVLSAQGQDLKLGESTSGCDHGPDLCGDAKSQLRSLTQKIVQEYFAE